MPPALLVRNLTVSAHGRLLVAGSTFEIAAGEHVALVGASGSGKSLTAAALLGAVRPGMRVTGSLTLNGRDIQLGGRVRPPFADLAAVHQDPTTALNPMVRIGRQLAIPSRKAGLSAQAARERAGELLASVGIEYPERVLDGYSGDLSGGQLQRVCIALALACRSSLLIADEPTTALDTVSQAQVLDALARPSEPAAAMLFITHDLAVAATLCTRAIVMQAGRIVDRSPMDELIARPSHPYSRELVDAARARSHAFSPAAGA